MSETTDNAPLAPPEPVAAVTPADAATRVPLTPDETTKLDAQVQTFAREIVALPVDGDDFKQRVDAISQMGNAEVARSASVSNRLLDRPARAMNAGLFDGGSQVSRALVDLRDTVEKLDPSKQGDLFAPRRLLGIIPFGSKIQAYFRGFESSQSHLNAIIETLYRSKDELLRDNASIEQEKQNLWALMKTLEQYSYLARKVADAVEAQIAQVGATDARRAQILKEDVLFAARQKQMDIATQLAVNVQGYLALDLVKRNNAELIKGVERATTTTVSALRTAVITAQALANQKLVLDQISALNTTTSNLIESTSAMLRDNAGRVYEQASSSTVNVQQLTTAFANVRTAIDNISQYKTQAIASMAKTVDALDAEVAKSREYLDRNRDAVVASSIETLPAAGGVARIGP